MKKLSVLMAGLTAVSIGGVYAAWTYAEAGLTPITSTEQVVSVAGIDTSSTSTKAGSFDMVLENVSFTIDSAKALKDANKLTDTAEHKYHQHEAVLNVTGTITVYFFPSSIAADDILEKGLSAKTYFTIPEAINLGNITWNIDEDPDEERVLTFDNLERQLGEGEADPSHDGEWTRLTNFSYNDEIYPVAFQYTYTETMLKSMFTLEKGIVLDNSTKHTQFDNKFDGLTVKLHVEQM